MAEQAGSRLGSVWVVDGVVLLARVLSRATPALQSPLASSALEVLPPRMHSLFPEDQPQPSAVQSFAHKAAEQSATHGLRLLSAAEVLSPSWHSLAFVDQPQGSLHSCAHLLTRYNMETKIIIFTRSFVRESVHTIAFVTVGRGGKGTIRVGGREVMCEQRLG